MRGERKRERSQREVCPAMGWAKLSGNWIRYYTPRASFAYNRISAQRGYIYRGREGKVSLEAIYNTQATAVGLIPDAESACVVAHPAHAADESRFSTATHLAAKRCACIYI